MTFIQNLFSLVKSNVCFITKGSIAEKLVFGESDDKNCSKNEQQNDNMKETDKINQETKVENS